MVAGPLDRAVGVVVQATREAVARDMAGEECV
jgi:hypothetical protein